MAEHTPEQEMTDRRFAGFLPFMPCPKCGSHWRYATVDDHSHCPDCAFDEHLSAIDMHWIESRRSERVT